MLSKIATYSILSLFVLAMGGCGGSNNTSPGSGTDAGSGGMGDGGSVGTGGSSENTSPGSGTDAGSGGMGDGGASSTGGSATGGASSTGSSATGGASSTGGSATGGASSTGGSATGGASSTGSSATGGTGGVCNAIALPTESVTPIVETTAAPAPLTAGGTIVPGTYRLTARHYYGINAGQTYEKQRFVVDGTSMNGVYEWSNQPLARHTDTIAISGASITLTRNCGGTSVATMTFEAVANSITFRMQIGAGATVATYEKEN